MLNKEKILRENQNQIKQHKHKQASTTHRTDEQKQSITESTDIEKISERKYKIWKKNNDTNTIMTNSKGYPSTRDQ
jgi:hypothetical protein